VTTGAGPGVPGVSQRTVTFKKGMHHFDGKDAMLYVRIRKAYAEGDYTRAARQQAFLQAIQKKLVQPGNITKLPEIGKRFMSGVSTDLTTNQILELAYLKWRSSGGKKLVMKGTFDWYQGQAVVMPPSAAARQKMVDKFLSD
jgi:anionic cell wall polymer biosynthesis LytR-Cps2A-Psr (LCP) family protein